MMFGFYIWQSLFIFEVGIIFTFVVEKRCTIEVDSYKWGFTFVVDFYIMENFYISGCNNPQKRAMMKVFLLENVNE